MACPSTLAMMPLREAPIAALSALGVRPVGLGTTTTRRSLGRDGVGDLLGAVVGGADGEHDLDLTWVALGEDLSTASRRCRSSLRTGMTTEMGGQPRVSAGACGRVGELLHGGAHATVRAGEDGNRPLRARGGHACATRTRRTRGARGRRRLRRRPARPAACSAGPSRSAGPGAATAPRRRALVRGPGRHRSGVGADRLRDARSASVDAGVTESPPRGADEHPARRRGQARRPHPQAAERAQAGPRGRASAPTP